jgi:hypothetical protein
MRLYQWFGEREFFAVVRHYWEGGGVGLQEDRIVFSSIH